MTDNVTQTHTPGPIGASHTGDPSYQLETSDSECIVAEAIDNGADARLLAAAYTSYDKHCGPRAIEAAEDDLLGQALDVLSNLANSFEKHRPKEYWDAARAVLKQAGRL